jgi:hypothetical protein
VKDVQLWRAAWYWRSVNIVLGGLLVFVVGMIGARAFSYRVGLLAAALCAATPRFTAWFTRSKEEALLTLGCAVVMYCACRVLDGRGARRRWVAVAGVATGSALAFKYNAVPIVPFFLLALLMSPTAANAGEAPASKWLTRARVIEVFLYLALSVATFLLWFPQLILRTKDVLTNMAQFSQFRCLNLAAQKMPSLDTWLSVLRRTCRELFFAPSSSDQYPIYFSLLELAVLAAAPVYAIRRRDRFVFCLWFFAALTFLAVYYQYVFGDWKQPHYFIAAMVPVLLILVAGIDRVCEKWAGPLARRTGLSARVLHLSLLVLVCLSPLVKSYSGSLYSLKVLHGIPEKRRLRTSIVQGIPAGVKMLDHEGWLKPLISDSFVWKDRFVYGGRDRVGKATVQDLVEQGFDLVCLRLFDPKLGIQMSPYYTELTEPVVNPVFTLPAVSAYLPLFYFIPVQPNDGESFHLGLYSEEPSGGDYAAVRGVVPPAVSLNAEDTTHSLVLKARLYNETKWWLNYLRWEVLLDGQTVWHATDTTGAARKSLALPIQARPGDEISIRVLRTGFGKDNTWGWGGRPSHLKIDGLELADADLGTPVPIAWSYGGQNGGPGPARYAMRTDWFQNDSPPPLRERGFDGPQPLVEAWRPYQFIRPKTVDLFPEAAECRRMARIEKAVGQGLAGSNALRFVVGYPAKESAMLGVMQPILYRASAPVRRVRVHYRVEGGSGNRGRTELRLAATALALSGEYVDRAEIRIPLPPPSDRWATAALDIEGRWKSRHARTDLMDFLEIVIETISGPDTVLNCLIDDVELE